MFFIGLEMTMTEVLVIDAFPDQTEKTFTHIKKAICPNSSQHYTYTIVENDIALKNELLDIIHSLNRKLGSNVFEYNSNSPNQMTFTDEIKKPAQESDYSFDIIDNYVIIGQTHCTQFCCGVDRYSVKF